MATTPSIFGDMVSLLIITYAILHYRMELRKQRKIRYKKRIALITHTITREIALTETDRITYVYARDKPSNDIREVTNVLYDL